MVKVCDHTSVGMLVWKDDRLLLIERGLPPWGFAVPAWHVDGDDTFEAAAVRELKEEVGLDSTDVILIAEGRKENPCRRQDGTWHYWKLYQVDVTGEVIRSQEETKQVRWYTREEIKTLGERTAAYLRKELSEDEWERNPGLEPVMYEWFTELHIV